MQSPTLLLASGSPRRSFLLSLAGFAFSIAVPGVDEHTLPGEAPDEMVIRLAGAKAEAVVRPAGTVALGVDTIVSLDGLHLGKPKDATAARSMLAHLSGRTHDVWSGWALRGDGFEERGTALTRVTFRPLTAVEIDEYVGTGEPMDKAGAYAIQGSGGALIAGFEGSKSNVMGLPLEVVVPALERAGVVRSAAKGAGQDGWDMTP